jgi:endonuclease YncB( thermonuclease family)
LILGLAATRSTAASKQLRWAGAVPTVGKHSFFVVQLPRGLKVMLAIVASAGATAWLAGMLADAPARKAPDALSAAPGQVAVLDGATLRLRQRVVRLAGIIPPARGDICMGMDGAAFDCGAAAASRLAALVRNTSVICDVKGEDSMRRPFVTCWSAGIDLARELVAAGWARADLGQSYLHEMEEEARGLHRGLWGTMRGPSG